MVMNMFISMFKNMFTNLFVNVFVNKCSWTFFELALEKDQLGVVEGVPGQERIWCPLFEYSLNEQYEKNEREHVVESKKAKRLKGIDVQEFLDGKATMSDEEPVP